MPLSFQSNTASCPYWSMLYCLKKDILLLNEWQCSHKTRTGPRHIVSLVYRLRVNALKTKYCKDVACTCREKLSTNNVHFNCHQLKSLFRNSELFPNSMINTFPTDVLYNPQHFFPLAHLLLKSPIGPLICIWVSIYDMYVSAYPFSCVCISWCSRAINYLPLSNMITILRSV